MSNPTRAALYVHLLRQLDDETDTVPSRGTVTCLQHSLQVAQQAYDEGVDEEMVFCALLHDSFRTLCPAYHGEAVAESLRDRVSTGRYHVLRTHGEYQADVVHWTRTTDRYAGAEWHRDAVRLARWEADAFRPDARTRDLAWWEPRLAAWL